MLLPKSKIFEGDEIQISVPEAKPMHLEPRKIDLNIFFEDDDLIVLYKPKGLSIHPGAGRKNETTLVHGLLAHAQTLSDVGGEFRPGIVHRLDKDTEGIVVVAKNNEVHEALSQQFAKRTVERAYWALCWGRFPAGKMIEGAIGRNPRDRKKMAITRNGKAAKTEARLIEYFAEGYSWVECKLHTGRTHQIRVHLTASKFPLLGDKEYGRERKIELSPQKSKAFENLNGQALVAFKLGFTHPKTGARLSFDVPKPEWLRVLTEK
jgi:23S rRNA pseudouridine1911/1915/1917 synthase